MTKKNRALALAMAVALVVVMLFSFLFIARNADHHCLQEDCSICQQIQVCENTLHSTALVAVAVSLARVFCHGQKGEPSPCGLLCHPHSLVSLKVKLSN